jgi:hypothetical protein
LFLTLVHGCRRFFSSSLRRLHRWWPRCLSMVVAQCTVALSLLSVGEYLCFLSRVGLAHRLGLDWARVALQAWLSCRMSVWAVHPVFDRYSGPSVKGLLWRVGDEVRTWLCYVWSCREIEPCHSCSHCGRKKHDRLAGRSVVGQLDASRLVGEKAMSVGW